MGERGPAGQADQPVPRTAGQDEVIDLRETSSTVGAPWPVQAARAADPPTGWWLPAAVDRAEPAPAPPVSAGSWPPGGPAAPRPPSPAVGVPQPSAGFAPAGGWYPPAPAGFAPPPGRTPVTRPRRRLIWWSVAVGLVVLLSAVSGSVLLVGRVVHGLAAVGNPLSGTSAPAARAAAPGAIDDPRTTGIDLTLAAMSGAVASHDQARFLSAFDTSDPALIAREREVFAGMSLLPMEAVRYSWQAGASEQPQRQQRYPVSAVATAVDLRYQLRGWDPAVVDDSIPLTFAPVTGRWVVVDDQVQPDSSLTTQPFAEPWSVGGIVVVTRPHVLVVGERAQLPAVQRLAGRLEQLVGEVRAVWPEPTWNGKVVAYAMTDPRFVGQWFGKQAASGRDDDPHGKASFVAKVTVLSGSGVDQSYRAASPRLIVTPYLLDRNDAYSLSLLRHEMTHVATVLVGRDASTWLTEGVAEYTGSKLGGAHVAALQSFAAHGLPLATFHAMQRGSWRPRLVSDGATFYDSDAAAVEEDYTDAWLACLYVADRYGDATLRRLYDAEAHQPAQEDLAGVDSAALASVLHTDRTTFIAAVRRYGLGLSTQVR